MASAAELRARLLAKRAAQQDEARRKEDIHERAKVAAKHMVYLGYNFDDILKMADSGVGEEHLNFLFRAIGIHRKRKHTREQRKNTFGASRWLQRRDEFIINFDEDLSTSNSEMDYEEADVKVEALCEMGFDAEVVSDVGSDSKDEMLQNTSLHSDTSDMPQRATATDTYLISEPSVDSLLLQGSYGTPILDSMHTASEEFMETDSYDTEQIRSNDQSLEATNLGGLSAHDADSASPKDSSQTAMVAQDLSHTHTEPKVEETVKEPEEANGQAVQHELEKVKAQVAEMQQRKLARDADQNLAKQNMKLRDIASRRALLSQQRERINVREAVSKVSWLEKQLSIAKSHLESINAHVKSLETETTELEKQEALLREELSRPKINLVSAGQAFLELAPAQQGEEGVTQKDEPRFLALTAKDSPLRAFSSFRMCPSLGPSHWFSTSFNGRFIENLPSRSLCATELSNKNGSCMDASCDDVHLADFELSPLQVCQYMATRQIDRPGFRSQLMETISTYLHGNEVPADQLAASIIGFCRKYDATQILDWQGWQVARPL